MSSLEVEAVCLEGGKEDELSFLGNSSHCRQVTLPSSLLSPDCSWIPEVRLLSSTRAPNIPASSKPWLQPHTRTFEDLGSWTASPDDPL